MILFPYLYSSVLTNSPTSTPTLVELNVLYLINMFPGSISYRRAQVEG